MSEHNEHHPLAESLSALMDNQASEFELQRVLKASESDTGVKMTWARYQAISASLRGERAALASDDFMARLSIALESEPAHESQSYVAAKSPVQVGQQNQNIVGQAGALTLNQGWRHQIGRASLAASVAIALVVGVNKLNISNPSVDVASNPVTSTVAPSKAPSLNLPVATPLNTRNVALQSNYEMRPQETRRVQFQPRISGQPTISEEELARYVNQLIQIHSDNAAQNSGQGVLPYARVILTEDE